MVSKFKRIVLHWTGGGYKANGVDKKAYHFIVEGDGNIVEGMYKPEDNLDTSDGKYAAHIANRNTGSIGIAVACRKDKFTQPTRKQIEAMCKLTAELCKKYGLPIAHHTISTHCELDPKRKIDLIDIPCIASYGKENSANELRKKVLWYYKLL